MRLLGGNNFIRGEIDLLSDTIKVILLDRRFVEPAVGSHLSDIPSIQRMSESITLINKTISTSGGDANFFADNVTFTSVVADPDPGDIDGVQAVVYKDSGTESTSPLLFLFDPFVHFTPAFKLVTGANMDLDWSTTVARRVIPMPNSAGNTMYDPFRENFLQGSFDLMNDTLKVVAVDATYSFTATDEFLSDIASGDRVATSEAIPTGLRSLTNGIITITGEVQILNPTGNDITQYVLYKDTGTDSTSELIWHNGITTHTPDGFDLFIYVSGNEMFRFPIFFA